MYKMKGRDGKYRSKQKDETDVNIPLVLKEFREVFQNRDMSNEDSVLLFNVGTHYVRTTSLEMGRRIIDSLINVVKRHKVNTIWKGQMANGFREKKKSNFFLAFSTNQVNYWIFTRRA